MHPANDKELAAIVGTRPSPDYLWCDECLRWEHGDVYDNKKPPVGPRAWGWAVLYCWLSAAAHWAERRYVLAQARHLVRSGQGVGPSV